MRFSLLLLTYLYCCGGFPGRAPSGHGIIDGNGDAWRSVKNDKLNETQWKRLVASGGVLSEDKKSWYPSEQYVKGNKLTNPGQISSEKDAAFYESIKDFLRPNMILLTSCKFVLLEGRYLPEFSRLVFTSVVLKRRPISVPMKCAIVYINIPGAMAVAKYGKGTVFAPGDPWIYNEYVDGRKLPSSFQNYQAAEEWVRWLIKKASNR